jgi:TldD protein
MRKGIGGTGLVLSSPLFFDLAACRKVPDEQEIFSQYFGISREDMAAILRTALSSGGSYADLFFEYRLSHSIRMEEDIIKNTAENISLGVGIRVVRDDQTGYGYTNRLDRESMEKTARTAAAIASGGKTGVADLSVIDPRNNYYPVDIDFSGLDMNKKIGMLEDAARGARGVSRKINQVNAYLADELQYVTIATSEGQIISDVRPMVRLSVMPRAVSDRGVEVAYASIGGRIGAEHFQGEGSPQAAGRQAAEDVLELLQAGYAPAGEMPVICGAGESGVMVHEAVGHPLEADSNRKKQSIMHDKLNRRVASEAVTIFDDPTIPYYRGSINVDDEGVEPRKAVLIDRGILIGYIQDRMSSEIMKMPNNGHGRREDYRYPAIPRMTNTAIAAGEADPEDIIKTVDLGFYTKRFMGGQVFDNGKFVFSVRLGYLVEKGKITRPVKNATIMGTNIQVLNGISLVGNDMAFRFLGTCGKDGQSVPVSCGTPTLKIDRMTVGGRS